MNKKSRSRRSQRSGRPASPPKPKQIVLSNDGTPFEGDCSCPLCAELARQGEPLYTIDERGELVEVPQRPAQPLISVLVRGDRSVADLLPPDETVIEVPAGCVAEDLLAYLFVKAGAPGVVLMPGMLEAVHGGFVMNPLEVVRPGDRITVRAAFPAA